MRLIADFLKVRFFQKISVLCGVLFALQANAQLIIQEESPGFCAMDGVIDSAPSGEGFTGSGYLDYISFVKWSITVENAGTYTLSWRYALGGGNTDNRDGQVYLNDTELVDTVVFAHTGDWATYQESSIQLHLEEGTNEIRVRSFSSKYLPHIDYFKVEEDSGVGTGDCIARYTLSVGINDESAGSISYEPVQEFYPEGTEITLTATPNPGYFFQSWEGNDADTAPVYSLKISKNTELTALFLPEGTQQVEGVIGYATVQNDKGTPYLLTGGSLGDTVAATSLEELQELLVDDIPRVVTLDRPVKGQNTDYLKIGSHKTLLGITDSAHIQGVRTQLQESKNVIVKKIKFSKTITYDAFQINSGSEQIWIDSCEFFSDREHHKDYYDGLLDIKNSSSFITVSWTKFHDHAKSILIASGDQEVQDSVLRITFHHNYFYNNGSRLPSLRFGKAHIFNNYYRNNDGGINTRVGACIQVEKNLFENNNGNMLQVTGDAGYELIDNVGVSATNVPTCELNVPYEYESVLEDDPTQLKKLWKEENKPQEPQEPEPPLSLDKELNQLRLFPNPTSDQLHIAWPEGNFSPFKAELINMAGVIVMEMSLTKEGILDMSGVQPGVYLIRISAGQKSYQQQLIVIR